MPFVKSTDMKWLSVGRQKEGTEGRRIVIVYKFEGSFLDFLEFICARCATEMPSKGVVAKNREADQRLCFRYKDSTIPLLS